MLTKTPHLFDDATKVTAGDSRWQGHTSEDYWAPLATTTQIGYFKA